MKDTEARDKAKALRTEIVKSGMTDERYSYAIALKIMGYNQGEIGKELKVKQSTVSRWFQRDDVTEAYKMAINKMLDKVIDKVRLNWDKSVDRIQKIVDEGTDQYAIQAFRELRILAGLGEEKSVVKHEHSISVVREFLGGDNSDFFSKGQAIEADFQVIGEEEVSPPHPTPNNTKDTQGQSHKDCPSSTYPSNKDKE